LLSFFALAFNICSRSSDCSEKRVAEAFPDTKQGAVPVNAGQLYRFVHEAKIGDIVIYPSKRDRHIHIGRIEVAAIAPPAPRPAPVRKSLSLDEYLRRGNGRQG